MIVVAAAPLRALSNVLDCAQIIVDMPTRPLSSDRSG